MRTSADTLVILAAKMGVLVITTALLVATTALPLCDSHTAAVAFNAVGTCGPGGLIVVAAEGNGATIAVANLAALGLPAGTGVSTYTGTACPFTIDKGEWVLNWFTCPGVPPATGTAGDGGGGGAGGAEGVMGPDAGHPSDGDGTADLTDGAATGTMPCLQKCRAHLEVDGRLLLTCTDSAGETLCESRLDKVATP